MKKAILLVGHGSRRDEANAALFTLQEMIAKKQPQILVASAFLQFAEPTLTQAMSQLSDQSVEDVTVVPVFLYEGIHIKEDLPEMLSAEADRYPGIRIVLAPILGIDERMAEIVMDRVQAAPRN